MSTDFTAQTNEIRVSVRAFFMPDRSNPAESQYFWAYRVRIENLGGSPVQLLKRTWSITDGAGRTQQVQGDGVAVAVAIILGRKRHRQVAHFGLVAQIIVTHEAIEIERRGGPGVGVDCGDFRQRPGDDGGVGQGALGGLQRGPLRHVQHHLELRFVVEWQQFHCHGLGGEHRAGHQGG